MATRRFESVPDTARPPLPEQPTSVSTSTASRLTRYALIGSPVAGKGTHAQAAAPVRPAPRPAGTLADPQGSSVLSAARKTAGPAARTAVMTEPPIWKPGCAP